MYLRDIAHFIRHLPALESADWLWDVMRRPYHRALDPFGHGITILVGGAPIKVPVDFASGRWDDYESESISAFSRWLRKHPGALVLDIGSSWGSYSALALSLEAYVEAFDSDINSLLKLRQACRYVETQGRLRLIHGFLSLAPDRTETIENAATVTDISLAAQREIGELCYICLSENGTSVDSGIPCRKLDDLHDRSLEGRGLILKCDVEGAEYLVLSGAEHLIKRERPIILLSVHPTLLLRHGHSVAKVRKFFDDIKYSITLLAEDHEQHWWCAPS